MSLPKTQPTTPVSQVNERL